MASGYNSKSKKMSCSMSLEHLLKYMDYILEKRVNFAISERDENADTFLVALIEEIDYLIDTGYEKELKTMIFEYDNPEMARKLKYERELEVLLKEDPDYVDPADLPQWRNLWGYRMQRKW